MTKADYTAYQKAVAEFHEYNDVKIGCCGPKHIEPEVGFEPFFSWSPCECCRSAKGGDQALDAELAFDDLTRQAKTAWDKYHKVKAALALAKGDKERGK